MNPARAVGPRVYPWVRADPGLVPEALAKLDRHLAAWRELLRDVEQVLGTSLAVEPQSSAAAAGVSHALILARDALAQLSTAIDDHAPALRDGGDAPKGRLPAGSMDALRVLAEADGRCRVALEAAAEGLPTCGLRPWFEPGVTAPADPKTLAGDPDALRSAVAGWPAADVAMLLAAYPALGDAVCAPSATGPPGGALVSSPTDVVSRSSTKPRSENPADTDHGASLRRVVDVRSFLAERDPDEVRRWGLLWPSVLGGLDGVPPPVRFEANRLRLRHALAASLDADRRYEQEAVRRRTASRGRFAGARAAFRGAWSSRDALASVWSPGWVFGWQARSDARVRIRLLQSLLHRENRDGRTGPGRPPRRRQVLVFDPVGRGRLVEVCGRLDDATQHLVVVVPGTGTALRGFHLPASFAADLVAADHRGRTAAVAWMGCDFPGAFANESPLARFAWAGAPRLRDVIEALDPPPGADITVIGHSYGGVLIGAAERLGMRVDKVVHLASAGAGPGVERVEDYPDTDPLGRPRRVRRWSLTAPGDPITWARRVDLSGRARRLGRRPAPVGLLPVRSGLAELDLGADPATLAGVRVLDAGHWEQDVGRHRAGDPLTGVAGHTAITHRHTSAFRQIAAVVTRECGDGRGNRPDVLLRRLVAEDLTDRP